MSRRTRLDLDLLDRETAGLLVLGAAFLLGSVAGALAAGLAETEDALADYLHSCLILLSGESVPLDLWELARSVLGFPLLALLLGFTAAGVVGLPVLFAARGFLLSFPVAMFYRLLGAPGELAAFLLYGLSALIWLPVLFHLGVQSLLASYCLLRRCLGEGRYPLRYDGRYLVRCGVCAGALAACAAVEYLIVPALFQMAAGAF